MRREADSRFFILNHEILPAGRMEIFDRIENAAVYKVIKVVEGCGMRWKRRAHLRRCW